MVPVVEDIEGLETRRPGDVIGIKRPNNRPKLAWSRRILEA